MDSSTNIVYLDYRSSSAEKGLSSNSSSPDSLSTIMQNSIIICEPSCVIESTPDRIKAVLK